MSTRPDHSTNHGSDTGSIGTTTVRDREENGETWLEILTTFPIGHGSMLSLLDRTRCQLEGNPYLVPRMGPTTIARAFKNRRVGLHDLLYSPRASWRKHAARLLDMIRRFDVQGLRQEKKIHDFDLLFCFSPHQIAYVDIETTALRDAKVFMIGIGTIEDATRTLTVTQLFARSFAEEGAIVSQARAILGGKACLVSFNGKAFDIPILNDRHFYYASRPIVAKSVHHVDLMHDAPRFFQIKKRVGLKQLEEIVLDLHRVDDAPSYLIPAIYTDLLLDGVPDGFGAAVESAIASRSLDGVPEPLVPMLRVIKHNLLDVKSLHDIAMAMLLKIKAGGSTPSGARRAPRLDDFVGEP
jgi:uncharacterized protein YprB with RNaseH-like and TPR domain